MSTSKKFYEAYFLFFLLVALIFSLFIVLFRPLNILFFNPERFECSRSQDRCVYVNPKQDVVYNLSKIRSASCRKIYHPGIKTGHSETWFYIEIDDMSLSQVPIYRTGFCDNQSDKFNSYLNSRDDNFKIKQIIDNNQISISLYILVFVLFFGSFLKKFFVEIIKYFFKS